MMPLTLLLRTGRRSTLGATSCLRMDASPPSLRHAPESPWERFVFWLLAPAPHDAAPPLNRLPEVRGDFYGVLADIDGPAANTLRHQISSARTLRELWHLRTDIFRLVALAHTQLEAERRVTLLNRHFPARAPRSQFGGL